MEADLMDVNPFIDPYTTIPGGEISKYGEPLIRLSSPNIKTLVYKTQKSAGDLRIIDIADVVRIANIMPDEHILQENSEMGLQLDLNLFGTEGSQSSSQINPAEISSKSISRHIPTTYREARDVLHLITDQRTGKTNASFGVTELKRIARNLDLPGIGNKDVLAARIRKAVMTLYGMKE